jgi:pimeloyl-ACP methyl ester carboxylesterase
VNEARRTDRAEDALASLDAALSLWRGAAYDEFADLAFARAESARLEELRTAALEQRAEALIALDRLDEALELLERLASTHPLRERPRDQLMRVLYRRGRQADALAVCREFRRLLSEELGLEPSPALLQLEDQVLRHDLPVPGMETVSQGPEAGRAPSRTAPALDIRYVDAGERRIAVGAAGTGPPLVVLPGFISNLRTIAEGGDPRSSLLALLSRRVRLITYDRYGTGLSRGPVGDYSATASAAELASILDTLGLASVPVLGISCSGPIAVTLAVARPDLVSRLVLLGTYADGPRSFGGETVTGSILGLVRAHWGLGSKLLTDLMYPCATPEFARWFARGQRDAAAAEDAAGYLEAMFRADVSDLLGRVGVPSLVIHYTGDRAIPFRGGQDLAAGLSDARFVPLGGSLHLPEGEDAARVVELIGEFLG